MTATRHAAYLTSGRLLARNTIWNLAHDRRYALDCAKLKNELGWSLTWDFERGLVETIR